mmetsp:Transcript_107695/g.170007  ORF Transcript_107695/g.170007 Transcript_107695/m.170007 type:complete len:267 (-) Transcript_107695:30-830(-)
MSSRFTGFSLGSFFGASCRPVVCCNCTEESELLTAAWRESVEIDDVVLPKVHSQSAGKETYNSMGGAPPILQAPAEFEGMRSIGSLDLTTPKSATDQQQLLQVCLRSFTQSLLRGTRMSLLLDDGRTLLTNVALDSDVTHLVLHMPTTQCPVSLKSITSICSPDEVAEGTIAFANKEHLDERCSTLVLQTGQFLTFVFDSSRTREYFEMCMKVVLLVKNKGLAGSGECRSDPPSARSSHCTTSVAAAPKTVEAAIHVSSTGSTGGT